MFVADINDSIQDVLEMNFGFQILSVAGILVDSNSNKTGNNEEMKANGGNEPKKEEVEAKKPD